MDLMVIWSAIVVAPMSSWTWGKKGIKLVKGGHDDDDSNRDLLGWRAGR